MIRFRVVENIYSDVRFESTIQHEWLHLCGYVTVHVSIYCVL
jgi:hypothetical protein